MHKIRTIAEIGSNWNGDNNLAKKIISLAKDSGLDYVKFQMSTGNINIGTLTLYGYRK